MPSKRFPQRAVTNPFKDKNIGRRTGKDVRAGRVIRKTAGGFENFDDYWSESDADVTRDGTFIKPGTPAVETEVGITDKQEQDNDKKQAATAGSQPAAPVSTGQMTHPAVLLQSQAGNLGPVKGALNPFRSKQIGRRTGKDIKAGKKIGLLQGGFENFDDYWSETQSDADSIVSFSNSAISIRSSISRRSSASAQCGNSNPESTNQTSKTDATQTAAVHAEENVAAGLVVTEGETSESQAAGAEADCENDQDTGDRQVEDRQTSTSQNTVVEQADVSVQNTVQQSKSDKTIKDSHAEVDNRSESNSQAESENPASTDVQHSGQSTADSQDSCSCSQAEESSTGDTESQASRSDTAHRKSSGRISPQSEQLAEKVRGLMESMSTLQAAPSDWSSVEIVSEDSESDERCAANTSSQAKTQVEVFDGEPEDSQEEDVTPTNAESGNDGEPTPVAAGATGGGADKAPVTNAQGYNNDVQGNTTTASDELGAANAAAALEEMLSQPQAAEPVSKAEECPAKDSGGQLNSHSQASLLLSQVSAAASPEPLTQKSSVYLSIVGDVTGSITRQDSSNLSPPLCLFGTRKRLSYSVAASPEKEETRKKEETKKKLKQINYIGEAVSAHGHQLPREPLMPEYHQEKESVEEKSLSPNEDQTQSQSNASDTGLFVSLTSKPANPDRTQATVKHSPLSDDDDEFEILDDSKIYNTKVKKSNKSRAKAAATTQRKRTSKSSQDNMPDKDTNEQGKNKPNKKGAKHKADEKKSSSDPDVSPSDKTQILGDGAPSQKRKPKNKAKMPGKEGDSLPEQEAAEPEGKPDSHSTKNKLKRSKKTEDTEMGTNKEQPEVQTGRHSAKKRKPEKVIEGPGDNKEMKKEGKGKRQGSNTVPEPTESDTIETNHMQRKGGMITKKKEKLTAGAKSSEKVSDAEVLVPSGKDQDTENTDVDYNNTVKRGKAARNRHRTSSQHKAEGSKEPSQAQSEASSISANRTRGKRNSSSKRLERQAAEDAHSPEDEEVAEAVPPAIDTQDGDDDNEGKQTSRKQQRKSKGQNKARGAEVDTTSTAKKKMKQKKQGRLAQGTDKSVIEDTSAATVDEVSTVEGAQVEEPHTPGTQHISRIEVGDSALKSGISFRRLGHHPSVDSIKRSRKQLSVGENYEILPDDIATPPLYKQPRLSVNTDTPVACPKRSQRQQILASSMTQPQATPGGRRDQRRVTISNIVTHHELSSPEESGGEANDTTALPSMSTTLVHYFHVSSPVSEPPASEWDKGKIIPPEHNSSGGLRRSQRTRVKPLEWYKNERIIYDRRKSGPVIVAVQPSKEQVYLEQENLKRRRRRQGYLARKKQQVARGQATRRLSTQLPVPEDVELTPRTEVTVLHPHTQQPVHMVCFNPASEATSMGPRGDDPLPDDPYTMKLLTQQRLFTTGELILKPAAEKPLQRAISTAVLFSVTFGKILVTINRASKILETGDHFFVPGGTVYKLQNLRHDPAVLTFSNLMMDNIDEQPSQQAGEQASEQQEEAQ